MTNAQIIADKAFELMDAGIIKSIDGMPEDFHTFEGWKARGYVVRKGEKSFIRFPIWKHVEKKVKTENLTGNPILDAATPAKMIMKTSAFFTASQVERLKA